MILIVYTTAYRKGSDKFKRVAETLLKEKKASFSGTVVCTGILGKRELTDLFQSISDAGDTITEYHFIGHAGMYGPMYGTVAYPEQYSPYELQQLKIPFAPQAKAYFHCCRSARWFAPHFARQFQVETFGYHWYTSFSSDKKNYKRVTQKSVSVYAAGCKGRKSHGLIGSLKKYSGMSALETMQSFHPEQTLPDATYNQVAELYDRVFQDIKVREDEWNWLLRHFPERKDVSVVDIGCGNGALLKELAPRVKQGTGLDISAGILQKARELNRENSHLSFLQLNGPQLPVADASADLVISLLSFRYLDWDPLMVEIRRVLKPGGKILIVDMVAVPPKWSEFPQLIGAKFRQYRQRYVRREFYTNLQKLVTHPAWKEMLKHNPIRSEHEMKWYLESRFPGRKVEKINIGMHSAVLAFDSGDIQQMQDMYLTYP